MYLPRGHTINITINIGNNLEPIKLEATVREFLPTRKELTLVCRDAEKLYAFNRITDRNNYEGSFDMEVKGLIEVKCLLLDWCKEVFVLNHDDNQDLDEEEFKRECEQSTIQDSEDIKKGTTPSITDLSIVFIPQLKLKAGFKL